MNSVAHSVAGVATGGGKEATLRRLLETQDNYIYELEAKCKAMSAQLLDVNFKSQDDKHKNAASTSLQVDMIDLVSLENSQD